MMCDIKSAFEHNKNAYFLNVYIANTFEIMLKGSLSGITVTDPVMRYHISRITRKTEVTLPQQEKTCC